MRLSKSKIYLVEFQGVEYECKFVDEQEKYFEFRKINNKGSILLSPDVLDCVKEKE